MEWECQLAFAGLSPDRLRYLAARHGDAAGVVSAMARGRTDLPPAVVDRVAVPWVQRRRELDALGVALVLRGDPGYPERLGRLSDAPGALFVRGTVGNGPAAAVVGTRRSTRYGREVAVACGMALARAGITLVSGLARGIDGAAHRGTVEGDGSGVAVLGSGIDVTYPREHRTLAEELLALGGAVITEYPPGTVPAPWRFPARNRIIVGMVDAVVIVEAGVHGGALITAGMALEYGVPVFAVPGDIDRESSVGCNLLIRDGAHPVLGADDLVEEMALVIGR